MYLCSAASGYSCWKFKCIGFVLNGIDYCAVLVRWVDWGWGGDAEPYIFLSLLSLGVEAFLWTCVMNSMSVARSCTNAFELRTHTRRKKACGCIISMATILYRSLSILLTFKMSTWIHIISNGNKGKIKSFSSQLYRQIHNEIKKQNSSFTLCLADS